MHHNALAICFHCLTHTHTHTIIIIIIIILITSRIGLNPNTSPCKIEYMQCYFQQIISGMSLI
jgi:hypothetical protein